MPIPSRSNRLRSTISWSLVGVVVLSCLFFTACHKEVFVEAGEGLADWSASTHSGLTSPNYDVVFNQSQVQRIDIVVSENEYDDMQANLEDIVGTSGSTGGGGGGPGGGGGGGGQTFSEETPIYVAADYYFNGIQWYEVGVRYKGNSSLYSAYSQGIGKIPLRLKFDYFEDQYPQITNQKFYGFSDLSLSSNYNDESFMREKAASDIFKEFGVPAARSAFFEVYLDHGDGAEYLGLYTMMEVAFDTMLEDVFGSNTGNCYKPDGDGAKFGESDFTLSDFEKKTNEAGDWSDIQELYNVLHASNRTTDEVAWKADLEAVFDVDGFLRYLAANNTIQNWDTYGNMTHNYFLYHDPADGLLKWIVWDNNEAFQTGGSSTALSFEMNEIDSEWPLIDYLKDVPEYRGIYDEYIHAFIAGPFLPSKMATQYAAYDALIYTSATSEIDGNSFISGASDYSSGVSTITNHASSRTTSALNYLD